MLLSHKRYKFFSGHNTLWSRAELYIDFARYIDIFFKTSLGNVVKTDIQKHELMWKIEEWASVDKVKDPRCPKCRTCCTLSINSWANLLALVMSAALTDNDRCVCCLKMCSEHNVQYSAGKFSTANVWKVCIVYFC